MAGTPQQLRAGKAFLEAFKNDPKLQKAVANLRAFATGIAIVGKPVFECMTTLRTALAVLGQPLVEEFRELREEQERLFKELAKEVKASLREKEAHLTRIGFSLASDDIESWARLARTVEKDPDRMTIQEIYEWAIAWADRELVRLRLAERANRPSAAIVGEPHDCKEVLPDREDDRYAWFMGKRLYLGRKEGQLSQLFWLLAKPLGRARTRGEVQRAIDGFETDADYGQDATEVKKANDRLRKAISRLRERLIEDDLDEHLVIHGGGTRWDPEWTMVYRFARSR